MPMSTCHGSVVTPLAVLNRLPGWLGTLVISPDGSVLQSAGELVNNKELAQHFAAIANRVGRLISVEGERKTQQFKRLTVHFQHSIYIMTCVGDTIYVVKRLPDDQNIPYTDAYQQLHNNNTTNNASNNPVDSHQTAAAINVTNTNGNNLVTIDNHAPPFFDARISENY
uniref:Late endosomal/lysosomal adaptor and MAPK and MTOR activator 4 n=1 Tax=Schistosoma japonicum TaxID=6182 RepID=Q86EG5_SCHJA|nr:hypothetical protein [Schistosoma japonicum]CAX69475.1 hypothetical protein [Schistosoma japonicum]